MKALFLMVLGVLGTLYAGSMIIVYLHRTQLITLGESNYQFVNQVFFYGTVTLIIVLSVGMLIWMWAGIYDAINCK